MDALRQFYEQCTLVSATIYADIDLKMTATALCLDNIGLAVCHRTDIFGEEERGINDYIAATYDDINTLAADIADTLDYAGYFDHAADQEARRFAYDSKTRQLQDEKSKSIAASIEFARTLQVPGYFFDMLVVEDPKTKIAGNTDQLTSLSATILLFAEKRLETAKHLLDYKYALDAQEQDGSLSQLFRDSTALYETYRDICKEGRVPMRDLAQKYQINGFR